MGPGGDHVLRVSLPVPPLSKVAWSGFTKG